MKEYFDEEWKSWIQSNLDSGNNKDQLFKILIDHDYSYQLIKHELNHEPSIPLDFIVNPQKNIVSEEKNWGVAMPYEHFMHLDKYKIPHPRITLYCVENFFSPVTSKKLVDYIQSKKRPSTLVSASDDKLFRTSSTCLLARMDEPFIQDVDHQICEFIGIHPSYSEDIEGQHYEIGQEFKPHTDFFKGPDLERPDFLRAGQRTFTVMIYLNDVEQGGETYFKHVEQKFKPKEGTALIWNNLNADGSPNHYTMHHGMPVKQGYKAIITKWFSSRSLLNPAPNMFLG